MILKIVDYDSTLFEAVGLISAECFLNSSFYAIYRNAGEQGRRALIDMFAKSMDMCAKLGEAKCAVVNDEVVGFIMGFDYHLLKEKHPYEFAYFFVDENNQAQNNMLNEDFLQLDNIAKKYAKCAYLMTIAVKEKYRGNGIASELVKSFLRNYQKHSVITDVVSVEMEQLCKKIGFIKAVDTMADCFVYVKEI